MKKIKVKFQTLTQNGRHAVLTKLPAGVIANIAYASIRNMDDEDGAVQRILNTGRINSIKTFTLENGDYPGAIVLNWISDKNPLVRDNDDLCFNELERSAQIIDGQHRVAGIKAAILERASIATDLELPVVIYETLTTEQCANIFLSINTEQKAVPRSLVYDLYGLATKNLVDPAAARARDIAYSLNSEAHSPYYEELKLPGERKRKGGIALSTAVASMKELVENGGALERAGISDLETQTKVIFNFFTALQSIYGSAWEKNSNAFLYGTGFSGALDFFKVKIVPFCNERRSYKVETIKNALFINPLITQEEVKGLGGKEAEKKIFSRLTESFVTESAAGSIEI